MIGGLIWVLLRRLGASYDGLLRLKGCKEEGLLDLVSHDALGAVQAIGVGELDVSNVSNVLISPVLVRLKKSEDRAISCNRP